MSTTIQLDDERGGSVRPYLCWILVLTLGFYDLVYLREVVVSGLVVLQTDAKLLLLIDKIGFFLFAVAGLLIILLTEPYLRNGWKQYCLLVRFLRLVTVGFASLTVFWAILMAMPGLADAARPPVSSLILSTVLLILSSGLLARTGGNVDQPS